MSPSRQSRPSTVKMPVSLLLMKFLRLSKFNLFNDKLCVSVSDLVGIISKSHIG